MKSLSLRREDRYASVGELQREIDAWLGGFATEAENAGLLRQIRLFVMRNKLASAAAAIILILVAIGSAINFHQRNIAVTALGDYERVEGEKKEQARQSAPAYFTAALALEHKGDFKNAMILLEQGLEFDPELKGAQRMRALILAQDGRWEEALASARLMGRNDDPDRLAALLEKIIAEPEINRLSHLARIAEAYDLPVTANAFWAKSEEINQGRYLDLLPRWRANVSRAWGVEIDDYDLRMTHEKGLFLSLARSQHGAVTSLEPVRDIPLEAIDLHALNITDLGPLSKMNRLRSFSAVSVPLNSLAGLENAPLESLHIGMLPHPITAEMLAPLEGKKIDSVTLEAVHGIDTSPLVRIHCRALSLNNAESLDFLRHQVDLESLGVPYLDRHSARGADDWLNVLEHPKLTFIDRIQNVNQITLPIWKQIAEGQMPKASAAIERLRASIRNPACEPVADLLDLMEFLIDRKGDSSLRLPRNSPLIAPCGDDRVYARLEIKVDRQNTDKFLEALSELEVDLASIRSAEQNQIAVSLNPGGPMCIGAIRSENDPAWRWADQKTPWDFERWASGETERPIGGPQGGAILANGSWIMIGFGFSQAVSVLIEFPEEWLEAE